MAGKIGIFAKILRRQILINSKFDRQKTRKDMIILLLGSRKLSVRQIRQTGMKERLQKAICQTDTTDRNEGKALDQDHTAGCRKLSASVRFLLVISRNTKIFFAARQIALLC